MQDITFPNGSFKALQKYFLQDTAIGAFHRFLSMQVGGMSKQMSFALSHEYIERQCALTPQQLADIINASESCDAMMIQLVSKKVICFNRSQAEEDVEVPRPVTVLESSIGDVLGRADVALQRATACMTCYGE